MGLEFCSKSSSADDSSQIVANRARIREILMSDGRSVFQSALAWLWAMGDQVVPIPGIRTEAQAIENADVMEFGSLTTKQMTEIEQLLRRKNASPYNWLIPLLPLKPA